MGTGSEVLQVKIVGVYVKKLDENSSILALFRRLYRFSVDLDAGDRPRASNIGK